MYLLARALTCAALATSRREEVFASWALRLLVVGVVGVVRHLGERFIRLQLRAYGVEQAREVVGV